MTFSLSLENANKLTRFAKAYCCKNENRPLFKLIACRISDNYLTATMLDGHKACAITLPVFGVEGDTDTDFFIAPPAKLFKKSDVQVTVKNSPWMTEYETLSGTARHVKPDCAGETPMDMARILSKVPKFSVWFDPTLLATALSAFDGSQHVRLDFIGEKDGVYISEEGTKTVVLPVHPPKGASI